jgi:hypothetical protein
MLTRRMLRLPLLVYGIIGLAWLAPTAIARPGNAGHVPLSVVASPTFEILSAKARVGANGWFKIAVRCTSEVGEGCLGTASVRFTRIRPGAGQTVPLAVRHDLAVPANSTRRVAIRLRGFGVTRLREKRLTKVTVTVFNRRVHVAPTHRVVRLALERPAHGRNR